MKTPTTHSAGVNDVYRRFFQGRQKQTQAARVHEPHDEVAFTRHDHPSVADNPAVHELYRARPEPATPATPAPTPMSNLLSQATTPSMSASRGYFIYDGTPGNFAYEGYQERFLERTEPYYRQDQEAWLNGRIHTIDDSIDTLPGIISGLETSKQTLGNERFQLQSEYQNNLGTLNALAADLRARQNQISSLESQNYGRWGSPEVQAAKQRIEMLKRELIALEREMTLNERRLSELEQRMNNEPEAYRSSTQQSIYGIRDTNWDMSSVIYNKKEELDNAYIDLRMVERYATDPSSPQERGRLAREIAELEAKRVGIERRQGEIQSRVSCIDSELNNIESELWQKRTQYERAKEEWYVRQDQHKAKGFTFY
ncbi:MAG: hypothetical protein AB7S38_21920 [Vulcanimicrobiota bacterium]